MDGTGFPHLDPTGPVRPLAAPMAAWLSKYNQRSAHLRRFDSSYTVVAARENMALFARGMQREGIGNVLVRKRVYSFSGVPVEIRFYHPAPESPLPVLLFFHGGGHVTGGPAEYDTICRKLASATRHLVAGVGYRLAPEYPFPAGLTDGREVILRYRQLLQSEGLPFLPILRLCGESSGGALVASLSHKLGENMEVDAIALLYPSLDYTLSSPSVDRFGSGYILEKEMIRWCFHHYFQHGEQPEDHSPLFMAIPPSFPRSCIVSAGYCPLQDEAFRYVRRLRDNGVPVCHYHFSDMLHSFLHMEKLAKDACGECYNLLGQFFGA